MEKKQQLKCVKMIEVGLENGEQVYSINKDFQEKLENILLKNEELNLDEEDKYEEEFLDFLDKNLIGQNKAKKTLAKVS